MRYAQIRSMDISNGEGVGVSLFVQGCPFHCKNCFNSDTWDFNGGKEWTEETKNKFLELIDRPYIKRVSILGGEPLAEQNLDGVLDLIKEIREKYPISPNAISQNALKSSVLDNDNSKEIRISFPEKNIWLYTGFKWEDIMYSKMPHPPKHTPEEFLHWNQRKEIISLCNVVIDGEYIDEQRDMTLKWRGSSNQRVIDTKKSLERGKIVLYCD